MLIPTASAFKTWSVLLINSRSQTARLQVLMPAATLALLVTTPQKLIPTAILGLLDTAA